MYKPHLRLKSLVAVWSAMLFFLTAFMPPAACAFTVKEEEELSREFMKEVVRRYNLVKDPLIVEYLDGVGRKILSGVSPKRFSYRFFIVEEDVYNAFAAPAGHIFVNSGLMEAMDGEEELAGILAHEIAHVSHRHIADKIERSKYIAMATLAGVAAGLFLGGKGVEGAASALSLGSIAAGQSLSLAYSRDDEMQADQAALDYLTRAGYSADGLVTMLKKIRSKQWYSSEQVPTYLMTHPASEDRIVATETWLETHPKPKSLGKNPDFRRAHTRLIALYGNPDSASSRFEKAVSENPEDPMARYGYALVLERKGNLHEAAAQIKKALEKSAFDPYLLSELGKIRFLAGDYQEAHRTLESALHAGRVALTEASYYFGRSEMELGWLPDAAATLEKLIAGNPDYEPAWYAIGEVYSRLGKPGESHFYLGTYYQKAGKPENALFQLSRALKYAEGTEREARIREMLKEIKGEIRGRKRMEEEKEESKDFRFPISDFRLPQASPDHKLQIGNRKSAIENP